MIQAFQSTDLSLVYEIINDSAQAYKGVIPADRWHEPYMALEELVEQIASVSNSTVIQKLELCWV